MDSRLCQSLSHGCIRLSVDDAKWVYDHIKDGTGVSVV
ncbi:MAG: L,D-transpeptidase family protein [Thermotaleaceae bacterium]